MAVEAQVESVSPRELRDLCLSILFVYRPDALQFLLVDHTVPKVLNLRLQLALDVSSKNFHRWELPTKVELGHTHPST